MDPIPLSSKRDCVRDQRKLFPLLPIGKALNHRRGLLVTAIREIALVISNS